MTDSTTKAKGVRFADEPPIARRQPNYNFASDLKSIENDLVAWSVALDFDDYLRDWTFLATVGNEGAEKIRNVKNNLAASSEESIYEEIEVDEDEDEFENRPFSAGLRPYSAKSVASLQDLMLSKQDAETA